MARILLWVLAGCISAALTVLAYVPASWMAVLLEAQTAGRLTLGDAQGTLWSGSASIGGAPGPTDPVTPLLPGRFSWRLSPLLLLGKVRLQLENPAALTQPVSVEGSWSQWQVSAAAVVLPAERLAGLGAPLNTIAPSGRMRLSWNMLEVARQGQKIGLQGTLRLEIEDIASRLSPIKPLGAYLVTMDWRGQSAQLLLKTVKGPLLLNGGGAIEQGRLHFSGTAEAAAADRERLANLLNLLGQRRTVAGRDVIALEFK
ncbi:type II secretion system protein N [Herminiimonas sp. CN]|uniref:type II secretion system protein N n=1 Tax=Herminiimonas sp. CN TaxID=1349818 RepID=UPI00047431F2|nr:type II secretion system protein N [Herminiimonas sp. CN]